MKIIIQVDNGDSTEIKNRTVCMRLKTLLCHLSVANVLTLTCLLIFLTCAVYLCKTYIHSVLFWLESQDSSIISLTIILLFTVVSLPISVGYIVLVVADGYLFGFIKGFLLTLISANLGLFIANNILKLVGHHASVRRMADNETSKAIMRVISGPLCFKIVFCARLTPIPFGLQNTIFALSNVNNRIYHIASLLGLIPAQIIAVYVGTTLRSMQDVLENRSLSSGAYIFIGLQLMFGASLMIWIGSKARKELIKALAEGENKLTPMDNKASNFNIV